MLTINTNVNNLKLQRNLGSVSFAMQTALNRLSTGYRINNAEDDAAGLVISKALDVQTRGLNVASQNAQMATNVLGVADGALAQMGELTMRIRDLATQAANGGYSSVERGALEREAKELTLSLEQLVNGTKFNEFDIFKAASKGLITEEEATAQGFTVVKTAAELQAIATGNMSGKYILMNDVDLSGIANWNAIGTTSSTFRGTFDGNGFTISNLKMDKTEDNQGLFGRANGATIKNVSLENVDIKNTGLHTGGLVGAIQSGGTITNCSVSGNVTGTDRLGGLVGTIQGGSTVTNCSVSGNVTGAVYVGGFAGHAYGDSIITNCYATGNVTGTNNIGGFAGRLGSTTYDTPASAFNCYSTGNVYSTADTTSSLYFGGFVGFTVSNNTKIENCYSLGQNLATIGRRGGFVGGNDPTMPMNINNVKNTYFVEQVNGHNAQGFAGGGFLEGIVKQKSDWFSLANVKNILNTDAGAGQWNFMGSTPRLNWQVSKSELTFQIGTDGSNLSAITVDTGFSLGGFGASFADADSARATMVKCDALLKQINTKRGEIGANSNIIGSIIESNTVTNENLSASKSRIMDANVARESANMVKNQILQNVTSALLVQTKNVNGDLVLALLNGTK